MHRYNDFLAVSQIYTFVWSKYRPAILKLMMDSVDGPQRYKLTDHEFRSLNPREKGGYGFALQVFKGKALNKIKASQPAQDLLVILQRSNKALELTEAATYEFTLDKHFVFHVTRQEKVPEEISSLPLPIN